MLFSSPTFLFVFLPLTLAAWFVSGRHKGVLLAASLIFYAWGEPRLVFLLLFVIVFNFAIGELIGTSRRALPIFIFGVAVDVGVLVVFKYAAFIVANVNPVMQFAGLAIFPVPQIPLPLGISFFTFQAIAYLCDIRAKHIEPAHSLFRFAVFKSFFPQLIAGPIVRYQYVARDLAGDYSSVDLFATGARRFVIGLAKKVIIADSLASSVDKIFANPLADLSASTMWMGALAFALQIYFDFSGYSDMAIGMGNLFGIRLPENFNYPYASTSLQDFWRRWHITLSTWFRDYVYYPLGGNRKGPFRTYLNLIVVFVLCGFWHGPTWSFAVWGLYNGAFLILERGTFGAILRGLPAVIQHAYFILVVLVGWVIFRATDLPSAIHMIGIMFGSQGLANTAYPIAFYVSEFTWAVVLLGICCSFPWRGIALQAGPLFGRLAPVGDVAAFAVIAIACGGFVASQTHLAFIYFRF